MKNIKEQKFDEAYESFLKETNPELHNKAIILLLSYSKLDNEYKKFVKDKDEVESFFLMWEYASETAETPEDKNGLEQIGNMSKKLYHQRKYLKLLELFFNLIFRHFVDFVELKDRKDFNKITDHDLYKKNLIPSEIFLQFFIVETFIKREDFDWKRNEEIMKQNLACFIVCFEDIYSFLNYK